MKKYIYNIYLLAALFMMATACTKEDSVLDNSAIEKEQSDNQTYTMTINASKGEDVATTRGLSLDGSTLNSTWKTGEAVKVYKSSTELGTLTAQSDGASTTLSGTLSGTIAINDVLTLKYCTPNYASQIGTLEYIAANCDYATASVKVTAISGDNVTTEAASFANQQAIVKFTLKDKADNGKTSLSASSLVVAVGPNSYTITPSTATNIIFVAIPGFSGQDVTLTATVGSNTYTYFRSGVGFANSKYYTRGVQMTRQANAGDIAKIIATNGCIYDLDATLPDGVSKAGMIAYVGNSSECTHGLAIALSDDESAYFTTAGTNAANHTPTVVGGTWRMPSKTDWENMFTACAKTGDGHSGNNWTNAGFREKLAACSANVETSSYYWTSTKNGEFYGYCVYFGGNTSATISSTGTAQTFKARAVLAF